MAQAVKVRGKAPKKAQVKRLLEKLQQADSLVVADLSHLKVKEITKLRANMRNEGGGMMIAKNRLIKRALEKAGYPSLDPLLKGPTALAFGVGDPSTPAKKILELAKDNETIVLKGGVLEGAVLDEAGVKNLATMPGREELLSRMVGSLSAPMQKLVFALNQVQGKVVYALDAYRRKLEEAGG
jgi:large subunit ribosomal protein L10